MSVPRDRGLSLLCNVPSPLGWGTRKKMKKNQAWAASETWPGRDAELAREIGSGVLKKSRLVHSGQIVGNEARRASCCYLIFESWASGLERLSNT